MIALSPLRTLLAAVAPLAAGLSAQDAPSAIQILDHRQLQIAISRLATNHPELVTVLGVGESRERRKIDALRLATSEREAGRPAILIVANVDAARVWTSGLALSLAERLAAGGDDPRIRELLATTTLYIVPRADPDGAEARFQVPLREAAGTGHGVDDDRDGRNGEDGPGDVDGDGRVTWMRAVDPEGEWIADPTDPRAMVEADRAKGERGRWKLWPEGADSDGDGEVGEDPLHDAVVNRNFPHGWEEHVPRAGLFATDEPEARALAEFVRLHEDIALVLTYGELDNLVEAPKPVADDAPPVKRIPPDGFLKSDADALAEIGRRYRAATESKAKGSHDDAGTFQAWCYAQRGLWTLNAVAWAVPLDVPAPGASGETQAEGGADEKPAEQPAGKKKNEDDDAPKPSDDAKRLRWLDAQGEREAQRFVPWKPFEHAELGPVEIGGFAPYALIEPPASELADIARRQLDFVVGLGQALGRVRIEGCAARDLGGVIEVRAALTSDGLLPILSKAALRAGTPRPVRVRIELPDGARLVAGRREQLVSELAGAGGWREELRWLVVGAAAGDIEVVASSACAGTVRARPEAQR